MDSDYVTEGYLLMNDYLKVNRIKTKHRNFVRRLDRFYSNHKGEDLYGEDEMAYLEFEKYFFTNVVPPTNKQQKACLEFLRIVSTRK